MHGMLRDWVPGSTAQAGSIMGIGPLIGSLDFPEWQRPPLHPVVVRHDAGERFAMPCTRLRTLEEISFAAMVPPSTEGVLASRNPGRLTQPVDGLH